eukprot:3354501-Alexandrium_andersonii.AAC.1
MPTGVGKASISTGGGPSPAWGAATRTPPRQATHRETPEQAHPSKEEAQPNARAARSKPLCHREEQHRPGRGWRQRSGALASSE